MIVSKKMFFVLFLYYADAVCEYLDLREGKKCLHNNVNGTCINIFKCPKAREDLLNKDFPPTCSFKGIEPIICCTDCSLYEDFDTRDEVINPHFGILRKTDTLAGNKFIEYLDKLDFPCKLHRSTSFEYMMDDTQNCYYRTEISNGTDNDESLYPRPLSLVHTVLLGYGAELESAQWLCGGSIISEHYILTSANCTSSPELGPVRHIIIGKLNDTHLPDPWRRYGVKRIVLHPEYRPDSKYHDIALIETEAPISFSYQVLPLSIHPNMSAADNSISAEGVAWSELRHKKRLLETLESVSVALLEDNDDILCTLLYPPQSLLANGFNSTIQMCYVYKDESLEICDHGDNGASIVTPHTATCSFVALGVTSMSRYCGEESGSALYSRVSYYVPWIESVVWPGEKVIKYGTD